MKKKNYIIIFFVLAVIILGFFLYFEYKEDYLPSNECVIKEPDPDGYLLKICRYLREHEETIIPNKEPDDYSIISIEEGKYSRFEGDEYIVTDVLVIRLDCCYMGDLAYVDKETKEVIGFSPGDM